MQRAQAHHHERSRWHHQRHLWLVIIPLSLLALICLSTAGSRAELDACLDGLLYLPFAARPPPTPTPAPPAPYIRVDPACCNVRGGTRQDPTGEYVCFRSYDSRPINMTGWLVKDRVGIRYTFSTFVLQPGAVVTLHSGQGHDTTTDLYTGSGLIWNNDHDTIYLCDASDHEVDTYNY